MLFSNLVSSVHFKDRLSRPLIDLSRECMGKDTHLSFKDNDPDLDAAVYNIIDSHLYNCETLHRT